MPSFYVKTYGCKLNQADSFLIEKILSRNFEKAREENEADFVVVQSCGVIAATEQKILKKLFDLKQQKKKVILSGCLPKISNNPKIFNLADGIVTSQNFLEIPVVAKKILKGEEKVISQKEESFDKVRCLLGFLNGNFSESLSFLLPVSQGCLGRCSFCATRFARGRLQSFSEDYILKTIKKLVSLGVKEIQLTSQDIAQYGLDRGNFGLCSLLKKISKIKGDFRVRIGMANPSFLKFFFREFLDVLKSEKFYKFLHLPLQSGDNEILRKMKRGYNVEEFQRLCTQFKEKFPFSMLSTDVIVGFPGEDDKAFQNTVSVIEQIKPSILHITKFSPRQGTVAARLRDLPFFVKKERARILENLSVKIRTEEHRSFLNKSIEVLVVEKRKDNTFLSRADSFKAVVIRNVKLGERRRVKIKDYKVNYLLGEVS